MSAPLPLLPASEHELGSVATGSYYSPHSILGLHEYEGGYTIRTLKPFADQVVALVRLENGERLEIELHHEYNGIFSAAFEAPNSPIMLHRLRVTWPGGGTEIVDEPYRFLPTISDFDLHLIREGRHEELWRALGAHVRTLDGIQGTSFTVWAPNAAAVQVIGDFNGWNGRRTAMRSLGDSGVWEIFLPGVRAGAVYKFRILGADRVWREKADPMARLAEVPPATGSVVVESDFEWSDDAFLAERAAKNPLESQMSIYEVHLASWRPFASYRDIAEPLVRYVKGMGYTHVEFLPLAEHPFGGSWGYQVTGYYAPTSRLGHPDDLRYLINALHEAGIGVIMDWVPAHFPKDEWALGRFDGTALYEHADPRKGEHPDWGTYIFDLGRTEVRNFLVANACYWLEEFHVDGLRVDAVASMLYLDYSRNEGEWIPNQYGGRENLEAIDFLKEVNATAYKRAPGITMIAEESTSFPGVTKPTDQGGLGFGFKWNMGFMHDTLEYLGQDPIYRQYRHHELTFAMVYQYSENFILPISHDEVVHGKAPLLRKAPGDDWQQAANLRAYLSLMWAHPGKQLLFMGCDFAQGTEWNENQALPFWLLDFPLHQGVNDFVRDLNRVQRTYPALYELDQEGAGFRWLDADAAGHNLVAFARFDRKGDPVVAIINFSPEPWRGFRIGLPEGGAWAEVLNSDAFAYGGSGVGNLGRVQAEPVPYGGLDYSVRLSVPPLGAVFFVPERAAKQ
ncbi:MULTISPECIES: 1,4-alpha-glucan branching protein GlgB [Dermabacter]|uniref:1,4-alpha-glucan branching protein GlgB n=1 Tax=Dermabacter TaxID=36739 RepID=UPI0021A7633E|nr:MULTISPECIES: 1,4-alpha-glucan branching protein GlgB [Dermabacter]MCT1954971.1 1,4-alpha-glucan branching protein GlgB [Dermabacter hominis]MCT2056124.1 1,4-alpha-glucan branching protein GlgB [Dermabacter hominis]MCT2082737.1 1,4-alpha-glucan branching protein GlgB [Dermabacter hominis]MCT2091318.1 1,4-alpha-glucan branching protein GlgB [Dermabacter hominis]MCT2190341.1 1,4-alpha-glucan branching protein GlgB [Dermabacter hominis]